MHLLQRVVECAYHNMGRIRLVWSRLWTVVAQHLVSAACHTGESCGLLLGFTRVGLWCGVVWCLALSVRVQQLVRRPATRVSRSWSW